MIIELEKENLPEIQDSFIDTTYLKSELSMNPYSKILVLKENQEVIGYIYYSDIYERAEINQFEINSIHRNCGKGNTLLQAMINKVKKDITLEVRIDNYQAIRLYEKNNFFKKAIREKYYGNIDGILMERKWENDSKKKKTQQTINKMIIKESKK